MRLIVEQSFKLGTLLTQRRLLRLNQLVSFVGLLLTGVILPSLALPEILSRARGR